MTIAALSNPAVALPQMRAPEGKEGPGPDHDGDADDKGIGGTTRASSLAAVPQGMGSVVNTQA